MDIYTFGLLSRGYFPKELPPAFNTYKYALMVENAYNSYDGILRHTGQLSQYVPQNAGESQQDWDKRKNKYEKEHRSLYSAPTPYTISKGRYSRRILAICNPLTYYRLAESIIKLRQELDAQQQISVYSTSKPIFSNLQTKRSFNPQSPNPSYLQKLKLSRAIGRKFEVKIDISLFYPSIYTHAITWAILGKDRAKSLWSLPAQTLQVMKAAQDADAILYEKANNIDVGFMNIQSRQTHGVPIGPDASFVIAEAIMARVDELIHKTMPSIEGCRYYDDYTFFVDSKEEAEALLTVVQHSLSEYGLTINEKKIRIKDAPNPFLEEWTTELSPFSFEGKNLMRMLQLFFNLMWKFAEAAPDKTESIYKYALICLSSKNLLMDQSQKELLETLLYMTGASCPAVLDKVCLIIDKFQLSPNSVLMQKMVKSIFKRHIPLEQHLEVSWALWVCKVYGVKIETETALKIIKMGNPVCVLILLDIINNKQRHLKKSIKIQSAIINLTASLNVKMLYTEDWLLVYESAVHNWLQTQTIVAQDPFFSTLLNAPYQVSFYDINDRADYLSKRYLHTLPYNFYPQHMQASATAEYDGIVDALTRLEADDRDIDLANQQEVDQVHNEVEDCLNSMHAETTIYDYLLEKIFNDELTDAVIDSIVEEYAPIVASMRAY